MTVILDSPVQKKKHKIGQDLAETVVMKPNK